MTREQMLIDALHDVITAESWRDAVNAAKRTLDALAREGECGGAGMRQPTVADRMAEENRLWWEQHDFAVKQAQERATIKPDLTVALGRNDEMVERDEREATLKEKYVMWTADQAEIKPIPRLLTIPSICLRDQAMPMMLGDGFGGGV